MNFRDMRILPSDVAADWRTAFTADCGPPNPSTIGPPSPTAHEGYGTTSAVAPACSKYPGRTLRLAETRAVDDGRATGAKRHDGGLVLRASRDVYCAPRILVDPGGDGTPKGRPSGGYLAKLGVLGANLTPSANPPRRPALKAGLRVATEPPGLLLSAATLTSIGVES